MQLKSVQQTAGTKRTALQQTEESIRLLEQELKAQDQEALEKQLEAVRAERENLLIEQARQAASGDIMELRKKLQEGSPCPVCGSTHHPVIHTPPAPGDPITETIAALTLQLQQLTTRKTAYAASEKQLNQLRQQLLQLHKELTEAEQSRTDILGRQKLAETQIVREESICAESKEALNKSLSAANRLFGNDEWQKGWQQDPDSFRDTLTTFARQWHENTERLQQLQREQSARKAECESFASFLPSLTKEVDDATLRYEKNRTELSALQAERSKLLSGKPADQIEQEYGRRKEELKERLKRLQAVQTEQSGIADQLEVSPNRSLVIWTKHRKIYNFAGKHCPTGPNHGTGNMKGKRLKHCCPASPRRKMSMLSVSVPILRINRK